MRFLLLLTIVIPLTSWTNTAMGNPNCEAEGQKDPVQALVNVISAGEGVPGSLTLEELTRFAQMREWTNPFRARQRSTVNLAFAKGFDKAARYVPPNQRDRVFQGVESLARKRALEKSDVDAANDKTKLVLFPKVLNQIGTDIPLETSWGLYPAGTFEGRAIFIGRYGRPVKSGGHELHEVIIDPMHEDPSQRIVLMRDVYEAAAGVNDRPPVAFVGRDGSPRIFFQDGEIFDLNQRRRRSQKFEFGGRKGTDFSDHFIVQTMAGPKVVVLEKTAPGEGDLLEFDLENPRARQITLLKGPFKLPRLDQNNGDPIVSAIQDSSLVAIKLNSREIYRAKLSGVPEEAFHYVVYERGGRLFALFHPRKEDGGKWEFFNVELSKGNGMNATSKSLVDFGGFATNLNIFSHRGQPYARMVTGNKGILFDLNSETASHITMPGDPSFKENSFIWRDQTYLVWTGGHWENYQIYLHDLDGPQFAVNFYLRNMVYGVIPFNHGDDVYGLLVTGHGPPFLVRLTASTREVW